MQFNKCPKQSLWSHWFGKCWQYAAFFFWPKFPYTLGLSFHKHSGDTVTFEKVKKAMDLLPRKILPPRVLYIISGASEIFIFIYLFIWCGLFFLKSLLNLLQYCFCFMFWFFGHEACGILAPWTGIEPAPPALEGEVLTTGPPGKSLIDI